MAHLQNAPSNFDELEEGEIREDEEIDLLIKLEETCQARLKELLSMQELELKKFKIHRKSHEMAFELNCKWKISKVHFEILKKSFERHIKTQYRNFIAMQIEARNKEKILKENWVEMAKIGKLETSFFETPIPDTKFRMENFDYESEMRVLLAKNGPSLNESNPNPNLDSEEFHGNPSANPDLIPNPNSLVSVMPNPNSKNEEALKEDEMSCNNTSLNVTNPNFRPIVVQNPNQEDEMVIEENARNPNFVPVVNLMSEEMVNIISNSTHNVTNIPQINHPTPPDQVVAQSANNLFANPLIEAPSLSNQNAPPVQQPATQSSSNQNAPPVEKPAAQFPAEEIGIANQLFRNMPPQFLHENPLQNELLVMQKLLEVINQKHEQKRARVEAEINAEIEEVRKKYRQLEAETESEYLNSRLMLKRQYQTLVRNERFAQEFHEIYHNAPLPVPTVSQPIQGYGSTDATPSAARRPATPNPVPSSSPAVQRPVQNQNSNSQFFVSPAQNQNSNSQFSVCPIASNPAPSSSPIVETPVSRPVQNRDSNSQFYVSPATQNPSQSSLVIQTPVSHPVQNQNSNSRSALSPVQNQDSNSQSTLAPVQNQNSNSPSALGPVQNQDSDSQYALGPIQNRDSDSRSILGLAPNQDSDSRFSANRTVSGRVVLRGPAPHMLRFRSRPSNVSN